VRDRRRRSTSLVSVALGGGEPNARSFGPSISAGGRFVAFASEANDLVAGDGNGQSDVFVRDRRTGATTRVSVSSAEVQADGPSRLPSVSADGRYVAFVSRARNLAGADTHDFEDVFVRDRVAGTTTRVSNGPGGAEANGDSPSAGISGDGGTVVFASSASNLVSGDSNGFSDVFAWNRPTGTIRRVNTTFRGDQANGDLVGPGAPASDYDGNVFAFATGAPNLLGGPAEFDMVARDEVRDTVQRLSLHAQLDNLYEEAGSAGPSMSADGRRVAFAAVGGTQIRRFLGSSTMDVFVRDRRSRGVTRATQLSQCRPAGGINGSPAISGDGRWVAFQSDSTDLLRPSEPGAVPMHVYVASALPVRGTEVCRIAVFPRNNDPGTNSKFRLVLSKAGRATITIYRKRAGRRLVRRRSLRRTSLAAGSNTIRFSLRGLAAGSYVAVARGSARGSPARRASFTIRRP
jgi:Tol biopolymer transport system component